MQKVNKDLSNFGIKCECKNLYEYVKGSYGYELKFIQNEMPVISKNMAEFYKKLSSLDKFDIH